MIAFGILSTIPCAIVTGGKVDHCMKHPFIHIHVECTKNPFIDILVLMSLIDEVLLLVRLAFL